MPDEQGPLSLAERVAETARKLGISTALIGAHALAAHNYVRGTADLELIRATCKKYGLNRIDELIALARPAQG